MVTTNPGLNIVKMGPALLQGCITRTTDGAATCCLLHVGTVQQ